MKKFNVEHISKGQKKILTLRAKNQTKANNKNQSFGKIVKTGDVKTVSLINLTQHLKNVSFFKSKLKTMDLIAAINQLAVMARAGIPIHNCFKEVAQSSDNERLKEIFLKVYEDLNAGLSLSLSLKNFRAELGDITLAMVQLGENTGKLDESLKKLSGILQELHENQQKFKKAIRYPIIVSIAISIAFTILMLVVVPQFRGIFAELGANLPLATRVMLSIEDILSNYGGFVLAIIIGAIFASKRAYVRSEKYKTAVDKFLLRIYLIGNTIRYASMSRFNLIFTELVRSGIPITAALETSLKTISNVSIKQRLSATQVSISRGMSLTEAFVETGLYENMLIQMIKAGETSGQLDAMLEKVTDYYKEKFNNIIDNLSSYIEPILMIFIAAMVLFLALGIFMPMWELGSAVNSK